MALTNLELVFPRKLITCLAGIQQHCQVQLLGSTVTGKNIVIDVGRRVEDQVSLKLSGNSGFASVVENTYECWICSVDEVFSDASVSSAGTDTGDNKNSETVEDVSCKKRDVLSSNIRRSVRSQVKRQEGVVKRLQLALKNSTPKRTNIVPLHRVQHQRQTGRPSKGSKTEIETGKSSQIEAAIAEHDGESIHGGSNSQESDFKKKIAESHMKEEDKAFVEQDFKNLELTSDKTKQVSVNNDFNTMKDSGGSDKKLFLATRGRHLISDSVREKLEELAFKCPCCRYGALNVATFKYHLLAHHQLTWREYKSRYVSVSSAGAGSAEKGSAAFGEEDKVDESSTLKGDGSDKTLHDFCRRRHRVAKPRKVYDRNREKNRFVCKLCSLRYRTKGSLVLHLRSKHADDVQLEHILTELQNSDPGQRSELQIECPFCGELPSGQRIFTHMKLSHIGERDFIIAYRSVEKQYHRQRYWRHRDETVSEGHCPHCSAELKKCSLKRHIENHCKKNSSRQQRFHCHLCNFHSTDRAVLDEHRATLHRNRPEYVCETCGARYQTSVGLRQHSRIKHQEVWRKPLQWWTCQDCSKQFSSRLNLERHKPVHTREYHHVCTSCGKKFKDPSSLITHCRNIHEGRYRYTCEQCGHGMERKSYLLRHKCQSVRRQVEKEFTASGIAKVGQSLDITVMQEEGCETCPINGEPTQDAFSAQGDQSGSGPSSGDKHTTNFSAKVEEDDNIQQNKEPSLTATSHKQLWNGSSDGGCARLVRCEASRGEGDQDACFTLGRPSAKPSKDGLTVSTGIYSGCGENCQMDAGSSGTSFEDALCQGIMFIVHSSEEQVAVAVGTLDSLQVQDGSVIIVETDQANDLVVSNENSVAVGNQQTVTMNATMSDGSSVFLLPSSNLGHERAISAKSITTSSE